jgi:hypothetical protein
MTADKTLELLEQDLEEQIRILTKKRNGDKIRAFSFKMFSVLFAATITILLGLKVDATLADVFRNVALALGAIITVLNAMDAFLDYHSLWIKRTSLLTQLQILQRDVRFYASASGQGESHVQKLEAFKKRLNQLLEEYRGEWVKLREAGGSQDSMRGSTDQRTEK